MQSVAIKLSAVPIITRPRTTQTFHTTRCFNTDAVDAITAGTNHAMTPHLNRSHANSLGGYHLPDCSLGEIEIVSKGRAIDNCRYMS